MTNVPESNQIFDSVLEIILGDMLEAFSKHESDYDYMFPNEELLDSLLVYESAPRKQVTKYLLDYAESIASLLTSLNAFTSTILCRAIVIYCDNSIIAITIPKIYFEMRSLYELSIQH